MSAALSGEVSPELTLPDWIEFLSKIFPWLISFFKIEHEKNRKKLVCFMLLDMTK